MNYWKNTIFFATLAMVSIGSSNATNPSKKEIERPRIPTSDDFTWEGTFRSNGHTPMADPITAPLIIKGQKKGEHFNLYMEQGSQNDPNVWVENLIYENSMYTITHRWHGENLPPICFKFADISVDNLNGILKASQFVGLETVDGKQVNHFRSSCISNVPLLRPPFRVDIRVNIFSDIYVDSTNPELWRKWLQFGDGVGLDIHHDEWFTFDEAKRSNRAADITLPAACRAPSIPIELEQGPCTNLLPE